MIKIYKYKPELQEHAQYFSTEIELIKVLKEDMKDDIEANNTSTMFLVNESHHLGETTVLKFTESQAQKTLIDLLNNKKNTVKVKETDCWKCKKTVEYTEKSSFCPECLAHL